MSSNLFTLQLFQASCLISADVLLCLALNSVLHMLQTFPPASLLAEQEVAVTASRLSTFVSSLIFGFVEFASFLTPTQGVDFLILGTDCNALTDLLVVVFYIYESLKRTITCRPVIRPLSGRYGSDRCLLPTRVATRSKTCGKLATYMQ
ncbi:hypothetical protein EXN66_Car014331 [Channa argus]|uniref:Uncharacterized protein n=1 Tax=Channa argus TaxID=215402 RepID=A0A6G1Q8A3_CHAAH|nr:hypothetical protein EXN66_Car014331 [Channa argus]